MVARLHFLYLSAFPCCLTFNSADVKVLCVSGVILKYSNFNTDRSSLVTEISDFLLVFMLRAISSVPFTYGMLVRVSLNACSKASEQNQKSWWSHSAIIKRYTQEQLQPILNTQPSNIDEPCSLCLHKNAFQDLIIQNSQ